MSSSSSSSSSSRSSTPEPTTKRKREAAADDSGSESDSSDDSDAEGAPDVPVLSHAEQRRQKRKEKQEKSDQPAKKRKLPDGSAAAAAAPSKRQNSVWVGNLTFKTTTEALTEFFKDAGEITRIHMPTKASTAPGVKAENRGYAYVDFTTEDGKKAAIALSEQNLFGRRLLIKDGGDFTAAENALEDRTEDFARTKAAPGPDSLPRESRASKPTDQSIRELFDAHRPVKKKAKVEGEAEEKPEADKEKWIRKVRMGTFEDSGLCKGFAFVDFTSIEHATSVLADAVRRGAPKVKREDGDADRMPQRRKEAKSRGPRAEKKLEREKKAGDAPTLGPPRARPSYDNACTQVWVPRRGIWRGWTRAQGPKNRPKPGAALALAKRESAAIVPSQGKKVVF
ncbi:hypothetical protein DFH09DRAFT_1364458 [Mycena vulgaris]|nr:hypothetical protein DFH09DRAFT_1364458 [Mycena vulgaris]